MKEEKEKQFRKDSELELSKERKEVRRRPDRFVKRCGK